MNRIYCIWVFTLLAISQNVNAQKFPVDTLFKTGSLSNRINVVILGDGFTEAEMPKFRKDAKQFAEFFLGYAPYDHYKTYFNFFAIGTPSKDSGITNPGTAPDAYQDQPVVTKDTYYGCSFGTSIHRLVTVQKYDVVYNVLANNLAEFDLVVVLANTSWYGGSGGSVAVHTLHEVANTIGVHEIGHTFTGLSDEYWAGSQYGREAPNMTAESSPAKVRWKNWIGSPDIGVFAHDGFDADGWYKPSQNHCVMEVLNVDFCKVCQEATTERILETVSPIDSYFPGNEDVVKLGAQKTDFKLNLNLPTPNSLAIEWKINGKLVSSGKDEISLLESQLDGKEGNLSVSIFDSTLLSRIDDRKQKRTKTLNWALSGSGADRLVLVASSDSICAGETTIITAYGCNGIVKWSTGNDGKSIKVQALESRAYQAVCLTTAGTELKDSILIFVEPIPLAIASNGGPYFEGNTIQLSAGGGARYSWQGPERFTSDLEKPTIPNAALRNSGDYNVTVEGKYGCSATATTNVKVDILLSSEPGKVEWVKVFPNPARDYLRFETLAAGESNLVLYNPDGKVVIAKAFVATTQITTENLGAGIYVFRIRNGERESTGKIAIE
jgi:hypothetical protein